MIQKVLKYVKTMPLGGIWAERNENNINKHDVYELYIHAYL